jgi:hypothetical protein
MSNWFILVNSLMQSAMAWNELFPMLVYLKIKNYRYEINNLNLSNLVINLRLLHKSTIVSSSTGNELNFQIKLL